MFVIPGDRLPPGFAQRLDEPPRDPPAPRPAATIVLARDGAAGVEVLLLRRARSSGFVPGAYVFPGGRVDEADGATTLIDRLVAAPADTGAPPPAYLVAALREAFEETGLLLASPQPRPDELRAWRSRLMADEAAFAAVVEALDVRLGGPDIAYIAHWITPEAEPRRFDTRFFLAAVPDGQEAEPDAREMTAALWLEPAAALERFRSGRLPMVFPTVHTLEALAEFRSVAEAIRTLRGRTVRAVLPRLVRTPEGVGIVVDEEDG